MYNSNPSSFPHFYESVLVYKKKKKLQILNQLHCAIVHRYLVESITFFKISTIKVQILHFFLSVVLVKFGFYNLEYVLYGFIF
jgi:hypothetical protein